MSHTIRMLIDVDGERKVDENLLVDEFTVDWKRDIAAHDLSVDEILAGKSTAWQQYEERGGSISWRFTPAKVLP